MSKVRFSDHLTTNLLKILPQHLLSDAMRWLTRSEWKPLKNLLIKQVIKRYGVNLEEAVNPDTESYPSFNAFFTRELREDIRPIESSEQAIISPVDGKISQIGNIQDKQLLQAKGHYFNLNELLAGDEILSKQFTDGVFATIYLSPKDYHRIHMPMTGKLKQMQFVPGDLFSVSEATAEIVPGLFARNERVITVFETDNGPMVLILVGAIFVGSMETVWHGEVKAPGKQPSKWVYDEAQQRTLEKGVEMGRFNMGSTVIMLLPKDQAQWLEDNPEGTVVKLGQQIGQFQ